MAMTDTFTDAELAEALEKAHGQPTKAAEILGVKYVTVWRRIRDNPELAELKAAYRAKVFQDLHNLTTVMALAGVVREPRVDKETNEVIPNEFLNRRVDYKTRQATALSLLNLFKGDEGIKDNLVVEQSPLDFSKLSDAALDELQNALM